MLSSPVQPRATVYWHPCPWERSGRTRRGTGSLRQRELGDRESRVSRSWLKKPRQPWSGRTKQDFSRTWANWSGRRRACPAAQVKVGNPFPTFRGLVAKRSPPPSSGQGLARPPPTMVKSLPPPPGCESRGPRPEGAHCGPHPGSAVRVPAPRRRQAKESRLHSSPRLPPGAVRPSGHTRGQRGRSRGPRTPAPAQPAPRGPATPGPISSGLTSLRSCPHLPLGRQPEYRGIWSEVTATLIFILERA